MTRRPLGHGGLERGGDARSGAGDDRAEHGEGRGKVGDRGEAAGDEPVSVKRRLMGGQASATWVRRLAVLAMGDEVLVLG